MLPRYSQVAQSTIPSSPSQGEALLGESVIPTDEPLVSFRKKLTRYSETVPEELFHR